MLKHWEVIYRPEANLRFELIRNGLISFIVLQLQVVLVACELPVSFGIEPIRWTEKEEKRLSSTVLALNDLIEVDRQQKINYAVNEEHDGAIEDAQRVRAAL